MARRLSSRLSFYARSISIAATLALFANAPACGGGTAATPGVEDDTGGGSLDTGLVNDGANPDSSVADSSGVDGGGGDGESTDTTPSETSVTDTGAPPGEGGTGCPAPVTIPGCGTDSDCDGISDSIEGRFAAGGPTDTDKDGIPDYLDTDSDGDGIPDKVEWVKAGCASPTDDSNDADGDGIPNFQDTDSDDNGLPDKDEVCPPAAVLTKLSMPPCSPDKPYDFDGDGVPDYLDFDNDHDSSKADKTLGLSDKVELSDNKGAYVGLVDTDGDGIPDVYDVDSDNDFILDLDDGTKDDDGDGLPDFRDTDSDGDGVPDKCEARGKASPSAADYLLPLLDTNGDGIPDYRDLDSDGDFLGDGDEDKNGDCVVDADETSRVLGDTDGDGHGDLAEVSLIGVAAAKDKLLNPHKSGKFYFIVPYSADGSLKPTPDKTNLALSTNLKKGDVAFIVDTTLSMEEEIAALKSSLTTKIIPELGKRFSDLGVGVAAHDDFPTTAEGIPSSAGSLPFYIPTDGTISTDPTKAQSAANLLVTHQGGLIPESQVAAMLRALTGQALSWSTPAGSLAADPAPAGTFGSMRFRDGSLPILIPITDAGMHNGKRAFNDPGTGLPTTYDTALQNTYGFTSPNVDDLVTKLNELGAKVIGVGSDNGLKSTSLNAPYGFLSYVADKTGSFVPKTAFGGIGSCKTGTFGTAATPDGPGGTCRLVFSVNTDGSGLGQTIVDGVGALLNAIAFDVYVRAFKDPADTGAVDPVDSFMDSIAPQPTGGVDPVTGGVCVTFPDTTLKDKYRTPKALAGVGDIKETIGGLNPGKLYCFSVVPKPNTTVMPKTTPQTFRALVEVRADKTAGGTISLGSEREVLFIVPPTLN